MEQLAFKNQASRSKPRSIPKLQDLFAVSLGYVDALQGEFSYDVDVSLNQWAYLVGFNKQLGKHYNITALYNKGETREAYTLSLGYRW
ncbi:hypothetical protein G6Z94_19350 [Vibrio aestuarianus]|uniref:hypothetical protein n=1 Tax=Vibrio aestuarianus TaxID=28171 RepID=UPI001593F4EB|nr:hypothetical protein [Vibrio aestuarianus]NGZ19412.1 hypothetical protein [Vibrio aestuarianus]